MQSNNGRTVDEILATAEHEWRIRGVGRRDRASLAADLRQDLEAAAVDGVTPEQLLGPDVRGFARSLADEAGVRCVPHSYGRLLLTAVSGAALGAVLGYLVVYGIYRVLVSWFDLPNDVQVPLLLAVLVYYGGAAALVLAGALIVVRVQMRDVPRIGRTVAAMAVLLPLAGAAITPVTMGFARMNDYSASFEVVAAEVLLVASALAGATVLARWWALRDRAVVGPVPGRLVDGGPVTG